MRCGWWDVQTNFWQPRYGGARYCLALEWISMNKRPNIDIVEHVFVSRCVWNVHATDKAKEFTLKGKNWNAENFT